MMLLRTRVHAHPVLPPESTFFKSRRINQTIRIARVISDRVCRAHRSEATIRAPPSGFPVSPFSLLLFFFFVFFFYFCASVFFFRAAQKVARRIRTSAAAVRAKSVSADRRRLVIPVPVSRPDDSGGRQRRTRLSPPPPERVHVLFCRKNLVCRTARNARLAHNRPARRPLSGATRSSASAWGAPPRVKITPSFYACGSPRSGASRPRTDNGITGSARIGTRAFFVFDGFQVARHRCRSIDIAWACHDHGFLAARRRRRGGGRKHNVFVPRCRPLTSRRRDVVTHDIDQNRRYDGDMFFLHTYRRRYKRYI